MRASTTASPVRGRHAAAVGDLVLVELEKVVGRVDQAPFGANGGSASAVKAIEATVELGVGEHRLDELLSLSIELAAVVGVEHAAHEGVEATVPARSWRL